MAARAGWPRLGAPSARCSPATTKASALPPATSRNSFSSRADGWRSTGADTGRDRPWRGGDSSV